MKQPLNSQNKAKEGNGNNRGAKSPPIPVINDLMATYKKSQKDTAQHAGAEWDDEWDEFVYEEVIAEYFDDQWNQKVESGKEEKVKLNKPFRTPGGPKKFSVYVKNDKGNVVKVNFGDPNMEIKRDDPERRKSYRARHNCDSPGPKWKANYWSCKMWSKTNVSDMT